MGIIQRLPDALINQIAAGEVVQRPASVLKELLENSIDAKASRIVIHIQDAGKSLIQVQDNGTGMDALDAKLCFERHATSKIQSLQDLFRILTMGFRGEALASIAAVSRVSLFTQTQDQTIGTHIEYEAGKCIASEPYLFEKGTLIQVKNLFFNVPARRKFLKSNAVELKHLINEAIHIALSHPEIHIECYANNQPQFLLKPQSLKQRILDLFPTLKEEQLIPVEEELPSFKVHGFLTSPDAASNQRGEQFFFVNHRFIKSNFLNHAVFQAYQNLITKSEFPFFVLFIQMAPQEIDINIHPTKTEIKFENENFVYSILSSACRKALAQFTPDNDDPDNAMEAFQQIIQKQKKWLNSNPTSTPNISNSSTSFNPPNSTSSPSTIKKSLQELYTPVQLSPELFQHQPSLNPFFVFQIYEQFAVTNYAQALNIIHIQNAHARILYERFKSQFVNQNFHPQPLLYPQILEFSVQDALLLANYIDTFLQIGMEIKPIENHQFLITALPIELKINQLKPFIQMLLDNIKINENYKHSFQEPMLLSLVKESMVTQKQWLSMQELESLVKELFACENTNFDPWGNPILYEIKKDDILKFFT